MKICIDAGHGGKDPGAIGKRGAMEKDINLAVALKLGALLMSFGHTVIFTRTTDIWLSLSERADISNRNSCDLMISIHCNSGGGEGIETYNCPGSVKGKELALKVQKALIAATNLKDRGVKEAKYTVIYRAIAPAILVEMAFIDNSNEEILLITDDYRVKVSKAITEAITGRKIEETKQDNNSNLSDYYCLEFQKFYNKVTKTKAPISEDGAYSPSTQKALDTLQRLIKGEY